MIATDYAGVVETPAAPPVALRQRRRIATAASLSLGLHGLLGLGLFLHHASAPFGATGSDIGTGIQISLVAGFAAGGPDAGERDTSLLEAEIERDRLEPETPEVLTGGAPSAAEAPVPQQRQEPTQTPSEASLARGEQGQAAGDFDGLQGASPSAGGDSLAVSDLLAQIA
ncbi:MAG: hypothetical protein Q8S13_10845, partial [Dehalococcoidia bacterium]|nr:hypothetical protein [Dehalococcoidia bacterium]